MKRHLLTTLVLFFTAVASWAQNAVAIYQVDGQVATFAFTEKPVVTYSGNDLVLTTTKTSVQYPIYKLRKIDFDISFDDLTGIEDARVKSDVQFSFRGGALTVRDGEPGSQVTISRKGTDTDSSQNQATCPREFQRGPICVGR